MNNKRNKIKKDLSTIMKDDIRDIGLDSSQFSSDDDLMIGYFTLYNRLISKKIRKVHKADTFFCPTNIVEGLKCLETKFKNGNNVNSHQSRTILDPNSNDFMFFDWGILHFHLGINKLQNGLSTGTKEIVYAIVKEDDVYFICIEDHGHWSDKDLLEIVERNWPQLLSNSLIQGEPESDLSAKDISSMRKKGVNPIVQLNSGNTYCTPGGGILANGSSVMARQQIIGIVDTIEKTIMEREPGYFTSSDISLERLEEVETGLLATVNYKSKIYNGIIQMPKLINVFGSITE